jgi:hypothetical protein
MSGIVNQIDPCLFALLNRRAQYPCWIKFGINKAELSCLSALQGYLKARHKSVISWLVFKRAITSNSKEQAKMEGYLKGLIRLKVVELYEYKRKPGSYCLGISPLGLAVLDHYRRSLANLQDKFIASCVPAENVREEYQLVA